MKQWLDELDPDSLYVSVVTQAELEFGGVCYRIKHEEPPPVPPSNFVNDYRVLDVGKDVAEAYGELRANIFAERSPNRFAKQKLKGVSAARLIDEITDDLLSIQENDLWIVSHAKAHNLDFVTTDRRGGMRTIVEVAGYKERTLFLGQA